MSWESQGFGHCQAAMILPTSFDTSRGRFKKIISVKIPWSTIIQHTEITIFLVAFGGLYFSRDWLSWPSGSPEALPSVAFETLNIWDNHKAWFQGSREQWGRYNLPRNTDAVQQCRFEPTSDLPLGHNWEGSALPWLLFRGREFQDLCILGCQLSQPNKMSMAISGT